MNEMTIEEYNKLPVYDPFNEHLYYDGQVFRISDELLSITSNCNAVLTYHVDEYGSVCNEMFLVKVV